MGPGWHDLAGHHGWANAQLMEYCRGLDAATLDATVPGTYGTIIETLQHLVDSEASYLRRLTGAWPAHPWPEDEAVGLDVLAERAAVLATTLQRFLAGDWDDERLGEAYGDDAVFAVHAGCIWPRRCTTPTSTAPMSARFSVRWGTRHPSSPPGNTPWRPGA